MIEIEGGPAVKIEWTDRNEGLFVRTLKGADHSPFLSRPADMAETTSEILAEFEIFEEKHLMKHELKVL